MNNPPRLLDQVRHQTRLRHYSYRTEQAYLGWVRRYIIFHDRRHPASMGAAEVEAFLSHLASERNVAAATQGQALSAVMFLYKAVLKTELPWLENIVRATRPRRLPVVLTQDEARAVIGHIQRLQWLIVSLLYGSGLRVLEALRLQVKDIGLHTQQVTVRDGKGGKDRVTVPPTSLVAPMAVQLARVTEQHELARTGGFGSVELSCHSHWKENIRRPIWIGHGNMSSHQRAHQTIHGPACDAAITCCRRLCNGQCVRRHGEPGS